MSKARFALASVIAALMMLTGLTASASATANVLTIGEIGYNARGNDTWFNRNKEYITIHNFSTSDVNLKGMVVTDNWGKPRVTPTAIPSCNAFKVTEDQILPQNGKITVYVGNGTPVSTGMNQTAYINSKPGCGYKGHFLNNLADTVHVWHAGWKSKGWDFENGYHVN